ncbi:MAG: DUF134 domain-containing protein [Spartobacteria bacterium]|nr:DUF134 domain-containing protein [Spartobacteria bacterium]
MPRPPRGRRIGYRQQVNFFKPAGVPLSELRVTNIHLDEMEAIRLVDMEGRTQSEAAEQMRISQPTVARLLASGRSKIATAIVQGQAFALQPGGAPLEFYDEPGMGRGRGGHGHGRRRHGYGRRG